jgi:hypothetical protein
MRAARADCAWQCLESLYTILESSLTEEELQGLQRSAARLKVAQADQRTGQRLVEQGLGHLDVAGHSYERVIRECFAE